MKFILNEYHHDIPTDELIDDVKRVATQLGKATLTISEYNVNGQYHSSTICKRIGSWKNVLELAELTTSTHNFYIENEDYINDLRCIAETLGKTTLTCSDYETHGRYDGNRLSKRFGSWKNALITAGLNPTGFTVAVTNTELLNDLENTWIKLGRQPAAGDIKSGVSKYSMNTYIRHFGSWRKTLEFFVTYINSEEESIKGRVVPQEKKDCDIEPAITHKTQRDINLRLRLLVMKRDNFKCYLCGASPATNSSTELHIDHIKPRSKGGETIFDNLRTLCSKCNLGKGNLS